MTPTIKAVLFDLDGTLVDHDTAAAIALTRALGSLSPSLDQTRARRRWKELEEEAVQHYLAGRLTFTEQRRLRITSLASELGLGTWDARRADAWFDGYLRHYESAWRVYPDVRPMLDALAERHPRLRLGVLTNGDADQQREKLRRVGLAERLPEMITSSETGDTKPSPKIFHDGCARLGLAPPQVAYVGDRLHTDAIAAAKAGLRGVWLNRKDDPTPTGPPVIRSLDELPALLATIA
ncbi:HAD family hydrolase [Actinomadura syzygii]|uniref:HAD family hydrolase n=1 Tax=Actinomadura syzygii TaxID=1427538 RepID=A0A5D0TW50_9ACTN|nr:HAD family hydrolase [Actinomadura syzygii]TYC09974.1 HAD family hydrolase [Actinomadura syzygii]